MSEREILLKAAIAAGCPEDQTRNFVAAKLWLQERQLVASAAARLCDLPDGPTAIGYGGARGGGKSHWLLAQTGILFVRVGLTAQAELAARVLPRLALTIPMEAKLGKLLANLGGGLLGELDPNPFADYLGDAEHVGHLLFQVLEDFGGGPSAMLLAGFGVNRQPIVFALGLRRCGVLVLVCAARLCGSAPEL